MIRVIELLDGKSGFSFGIKRADGSRPIGFYFANEKSRSVLQNDKVGAIKKERAHKRQIHVPVVFDAKKANASDMRASYISARHLSIIPMDAVEPNKPMRQMSR